MRPQDQDRVRRLVERRVGQPDSVTGREYDYTCPFCRSSHLHVNYDRDAALCHGCGYGAKDLLALVRALYGEVPQNLLRVTIDEEWVDYCRDVLFRSAAPQADGKAPSPVELPPTYTPVTRRPPDAVGRMVRTYLRGRGMSDEVAAEYAVGYCSDGRYRGYAVFPVHVAGRLVTFTSRACPSLVLNGPKALHAGTASRVALLGFDQAAAMGARRVFVAEGPFSAWAFLRRADPLDAGVAILGKVLHDEQCRLLDRLPCDELVVCLDETEHERTVECADKLSRMTSKRVSYILLDERGDPDDQREQLPGYVAARRPYDPLRAKVDRWLR